MKRMQLKADQCASWLVSAACLYSLGWAAQQGLPIRHAVLMCLLSVLALPLDYLPIDPKHLLDRSWIPRPCRGRGAYCLLLVPIAILVTAGTMRPWKDCSAVYLLSLGLLVQALVLQLNCSKLANRTKQSKIRCMIAELIIGPVVMMMLKAPLRLRVSDWDLIVVLVAVLLAYCCQITLIRRLPLSFTLGESAVVGQGIALLLTAPMLELGTPVTDTTSEPELVQIYYLMQIAAVSLLIAVLLLYTIAPLRSSSGFYTLLVMILGMFSMPALLHLLGDNFALWIVHFILKTEIRRKLFLYWGACALVAVILVFVNNWQLRAYYGYSEPHVKKKQPRRGVIKPKFGHHKNHSHSASSDSSNCKLTRRTSKHRLQESSSQDSDAPDAGESKPESTPAPQSESERCIEMVNVSTINIRKQFHVLAIAVFLPGIIWDIPMILLAASCALIVFGMLEVVRVINVWPLGGLVQHYFCVFLDSRDLGILILTHLYLLVGCTIPLWLSATADSSKGVTLCLLSGILSLGIGDTMASFIGTHLGKHRWPGTNKSLEGTTAAIVFQLLAVDILTYFGVMAPFSWIPVVVAVVTTSFMEAVTTQIDNLILPIFMQLMLVNAR